MLKKLPASPKPQLQSGKLQIAEKVRKISVLRGSFHPLEARICVVLRGLDIFTFFLSKRVTLKGVPKQTQSFHF